MSSTKQSERDRAVLDAVGIDAERRRVLTELAAVAGATVLVPVAVACGPEPAPRTAPRRRGAGAGGAARASQGTPPARRGAALAVPSARPADWDALAFNLRRGEAGAIPAGYLANIKAPGGREKHLGKHLPYRPAVDASLVPKGYLPVMFGDARKGFARHPNAAPDPARNYIGHWFNWVRARKAVSGEAAELESRYPSWPGTGKDGGRYAVFGGGDIRADGGRNTIYLVRLPADVRPGDPVRIWGHCLHHGEYVDFLTA